MADLAVYNLKDDQPSHGEEVPHNRLLRTLQPPDFDILRPQLERISLHAKQVIVPANQPIEYVYFPEGGIVAYRSPTPPHDGMELGIIGCEGMVGFSVLMELRIIAADAVVQIDGTTALRIETDVLLAAVRQSPTLHSHLLSFLPAYMLQIAQTAYARGYHTLIERLARLLLLCHDRIDGDEIRLTHEFLAKLLAGQRTGITAAIQVLEGEGLLRNTRGTVIIRDRRGLEARAGNAYRWMR